MAQRLQQYGSIGLNRSHMDGFGAFVPSRQHIRTHVWALLLPTREALHTQRLRGKPALHVSHRFCPTARQNQGLRHKKHPALTPSSRNHAIIDSTQGHENAYSELYAQQGQVISHFINAFNVLQLRPAQNVTRDRTDSSAGSVVGKARKASGLLFQRRLVPSSANLAMGSDQTSSDILAHLHVLHCCFHSVSQTADLGRSSKVGAASSAESSAIGKSRRPSVGLLDTVNQELEAIGWILLGLFWERSIQSLSQQQA